MKKALIILFIIIMGLSVFLIREFMFPNTNKSQLIISTNTAATDISPYSLNLNNLTRTANIYEGLVALDKNLSPTPALGVSWGNTDANTWEFSLRQGVSFHDGSPFGAEDVIRALEAGKASENPLILPLIENIEGIEIINPNKIQIKTTDPDPLLLSKLSKLFIHKEGTIGTGPYQLKQWVPGQSMELERFEAYWGAKPDFKNLEYVVEANRIERENGFMEGEIDMLTNVTDGQMDELNEGQIKTGYGLEVIFLRFNLKDPIFSQKPIREAVQKLMNPEVIERIGGNKTRVATQFIAQGVFGYNEAINPIEYQENLEPQDIFGVKKEPITLDYLESYEALSDYVSSQLEKAGFSVTKNILEPEALLEKIKNGDSQLYLLGWQAADGDAGSFFESFVHSDGNFNKQNYQNESIDAMIEISRKEMDTEKRLKILQEIGLELQNDLIGIPLFETPRHYAIQDDLKWEPRLDGLALGSEVSND